MNNSEYFNLFSKLEVLRHRVDQLEANRPKAESDAAGCSPAGEQVSLPRSPDRQLLAKLKSQIRDDIDWIGDRPRRNYTASQLSDILKDILQRLEAFDLGDGHMPPPVCLISENA